MINAPRSNLQQRYRNFSNAEAFSAWFEPIRGRIQATEDFVSTQMQVHGYCDCCRAVVELKIQSGALFGNRPNLREGFICPRGTTNRQRLLIRLIEIMRRGNSVVSSIALFEDLSPLTTHLARMKGVEVKRSVYLGGEQSQQSGGIYSHHSHTVTHQDMTATSYGNAQFDLVIDNDVLEHVPDYRAALRECARIAKKGGAMLMTAPFFPAMQQTEILATLHANDSIEHLIAQPEYHGDPVAGNILAYYRFGWDLLEHIKDAGFDEAFLVCDYDAFSGLTTNNNHSVGNMPPLALIGVK